MRLRAARAGLAAAALTVGCAGVPKVERVVDARVVTGDYVEPETYAAFLEASLAAEAGDPGAAARGFAVAAARAPRDPELWTRLGDARCRHDARDRAADRAFARALAIAPDHVGALAARAQCESRRNGGVAGAEAGPGLGAGPGSSPEGSSLAWTVAHAESGAAWEALAASARARGDVAVLAWALAELARRAPARRGAVAEAAVELAGEGEEALARAVAGALVDAARDGSWARAEAKPGTLELVARLAVDEALRAHDVGRAITRANRMRLGRAELAARALLLGDPARARSLVADVVEAEPTARDARVVQLAATWGHGDRGRSSSLRARDAVAGAEGARVEEDLPFVVWAAWTTALGRSVGAEDARAATATLPRAAPVAGDSLATAVGVDLVARGLARDGDLTPDGRIELAARGGAARGLPVDPRGADARHRLLYASISRGDASVASDGLAAHLGGAAAHDTIVAVALARRALDRGVPIPQPARARIASVAAAEPLAAGLLVQDAARSGDVGKLAAACAIFVPLAVTDVERALAGPPSGGRPSPSIPACDRRAADQ